MKLPPNVHVTKTTNGKSSQVIYSVSFSVEVSVILDAGLDSNEYGNLALEKATTKLLQNVREAVN
jgi:hypothetical protein